MFKKSVLFFALAFPTLVWGQGVRFDSTADRLVQGFKAPISGATITACTSTATGTPCTPLVPISPVTLCTDSTCAVAAPNPFLADANGNFGFWALPGTYKVSVTAPGVTGYLLTVVLPITLTGNNAFTGNNIHSGTETFTGTLVPCTMGPGIYIVGPAACPALQTTINSAIAFGAPGAEVWIISPISVSSTISVGQDSPSHVSVTVKQMRGAKITATITGTTSFAKLSSGSLWDCGGVPDSGYGQPQIAFTGTSVVNAVFQAMTQDGTDESIHLRGCSVDGGASGGATLVAGYDYSETFEGTDGYGLQLTNYQGPGGNGACGIKIFTVAAATDGAASIDLQHLWIVPTGNNKWLCIDGTANSAVNINRIAIHHFQFRANGTLTQPGMTIVSGVNGQIKSLFFYDGAIAPATVSNQNVVQYDGCYGCSMHDIQFTVQSGATNIGVQLNNAANKQNFGNTFDNLFFVNGFTPLLADARAPSAGGSAQSIVFNGSGGFLAHYGQDDGNTTSSRWNQQGWTIPQSLPPANFVGDFSVQGITNKLFYGAQETTSPGGSAGVDFLYGDSADHAMKLNNNGGGYLNVAVTNAPNGLGAAMLTSTYTNATTTPSNITGLSYAVKASTNYVMTCQLYYQGSATTAGLDITVTGPSSPTSVFYGYYENITATTFTHAVTNTFGTKLVGGTIAATTNFMATVTMGLRNGSNAGTVQVQGSATGAGTVTVQPGSFCTLQ